ncbi:hypothetical protein NLI96_g1670 [Meripilus lineatus]|uniref:Uncharacterized protein n=1 Tax=Meripilus lineatus TaxID=2056292 RepID=A0AAD5VEE5_9APHY|nr:hypothetical protein NLI96_g1670 [Physisporinus lineatus]
MSTSPLPRPHRERERPSDTRDSLLRASILDTALELGIGSSSTVANWIFNPVEEADEDVESVLSPSLTYASTATSEESSFSGSLHSHHGQAGSGSSSNQSFGKPSGSLDSSQINYFRDGGLSPVPEIPIQRSIQFDLRATPEPRAFSPLPALFKPNKLRKTRPEGYDSDGGYLSDSLKSDKSKKKSKKKDKDKNKDKGDATDFESDGGYLSESAKKKKEKKKSKKDKTKNVDGAGTDYESDGGYLSTTSLGRGKKSKSMRKASNTSAASGDESEGGYLSEASAKTKRFFGLGSKSPKKKKSSLDNAVQEEIPPVPSLPPLPLPIAEKFSRSLTPSSFVTYDSRSTTPAPSEYTVTHRSSHDTIVSNHSSPTISSPDSPQGLPNAFKDAESVRSPSIDVLATFSRRAADPAARSKPHPLSNSSSFPSSPIPAIPSITLPKPKKNPSLKRTPPQISAPNTSSLAAKHTPVPLILTPPTPLSASRHMETDSRCPAAPSPHPSASTEYIVPSPSVSPLPSPGLPTNAGSQTLVRPHVLAFYDLPPPSPPPQGPLPTVPLEVQQQQSRIAHENMERGLSPIMKPRSRPGTADSVSERRQQPSTLVWRTYSRPGTADDSERKQSAPSPIVWTTYNRAGPASAPAGQTPSSPYRSPSRTNLVPPSSTPAAISNRPPSPLFLQRIPSNQRGRESPFPTQPVLPRGESSELVRRTSIAQANSRSQRNGNGANGNNAPLSADVYAMDRERGLRQQQLEAQLSRLQPLRSQSALDTRRVSEVEDDESRQSWVDYDDDEEDEMGSDPRRRVQVIPRIQHPDEEASETRPLSSDSHPDIDSVLSMLRGDVNGLARQAGDKAEPRSTFYFDMEDDDDERYSRYSVWSDGRPVSILDAEKSGDAREKFVKQVEAMYPGNVPPVPPLAPAAKSGMF